MDILAGLFAALFFAALITMIYALVARPREVNAYSANAREFRLNSSISMIWLFLFVFLLSWSGALWITPIGPMYFGVPWIPLIFISLLLVFLLVGLEMDNRNAKENKIHLPGETPIDAETEMNLKLGINVFLWLIVGLLGLAIIFRLLTTLP